MVESSVSEECNGRSTESTHGDGSDPRERDLRRLLTFESHDHAEIGAICLHEAFVAEARRSPESVAIIADESRLTYQELDRRSNQLARYLMELGVGPKRLVGIAVDRSAEMAVAIIGVLKAGAAYVPLDPSYPAERISFMVGDAELDVVLTQERFLSRLPLDINTITPLDRNWFQIEAYPDTVIESPATPDDVAYCIYTSGSTGTPKGTLVTHSAIYNTLHWLVDYLKLTNIDRVISIAAFSFDASVWEFWPALFVGGISVLAAPTASRDPEMLFHEIRENNVTVMTVVPSLLAILLDRPDMEKLASLRHVFSAGEPLPSAVKDRFFEVCNANLDNAYGPTEAAICATCGPCRSSSPASNVSIGKPIRNVSIHLLDESLSRVAIGVTGEIYIGGPGLAKGYLGRPDLTAERFIDNPLPGGTGRLYRTGDLARWSSDGDLEFVGRADRQVKIGGVRIEVGEVEATLAGLDPVRAAAVAVQTGASPQLIGYVVTDRTRLKENLIGDTSEPETDALSLFDEIYGRLPSAPSYEGWNDSYSGTPLAIEAMDEWRRVTVERILALSPRDVLEIGCGSGLLLEKIAPKVASYRGTDISGHVIDSLSAWISGRPEFDNVTLSAQEATDFTGIEDGIYDVVVLNSVIQYFPDVSYLRRVLLRAKRALRVGGRIFIGDVRSAPLLTLLHTSIQCARAAPGTSSADVKARVSQAVAWEEELVIDPSFFSALTREGSFNRSELQLKEGRFDNELSRYRYDVVLDTGPGFDEAEVKRISWAANTANLDTVRELLAVKRPALMRLEGVFNRRLAYDLSVRRHLLGSDETPAEDILEFAQQLPPSGEDPNSYWALARDLGYKATIAWTDDYTEGRFDVLLQDMAVQRLNDNHPHPVGGSRLQSHDENWEAYGNDPMFGRLKRQAPAWILNALRRTLPQHLVPSRIVVLDAMPLTPNGKLDHAALPAVIWEGGHSFDSDDGQMSLDEERVVGLMAKVLGIPTLKVRDHFFDMGGNSLLLLKLAAAVERSLGVSVPLAEFFKAPNARAIAALVEDGRKNAVEWKHLVKMNREVDKTPIFCLHGFDGTVDDYLHLARHFDGDVTLYGVRIGALANQIVNEGVTADLNRAFVDEIRSHQPKGPYRICGYSFAGAPAFDIACQLERAGEHVVLILLDAYPINSSLRMRTWMPRLYKMVAVRDVVGTIKRKAEHFFNSDLRYWFTGRERNLRNGLIRASMRNKYTLFSGRIILVKSTGADDSRSWRLSLDGANGWRKYSKTPIDILEVEVGHVGMIKEPIVGDITRQLKSLLGEA